MRRLALLAPLLVASAPAGAAAQSPYVGVGAGPAVRMDDWPNQVRVEQEIGVSFDGPSGFFLGFAPSQSWGNDFWVLVFPLRLGGVFDLYRGRRVRFQIGGTGTVGFAVSEGPDGWFHLSFGALLRLLVADGRLAIYLRPVGFEFAVWERRPAYGPEAIRYVGAAGIDYYF